MDYSFVLCLSSMNWTVLHGLLVNKIRPISHLCSRYSYLCCWPVGLYYLPPAPLVFLWIRDCQSCLAADGAQPCATSRPYADVQWITKALVSLSLLQVEHPSLHILIFFYTPTTITDNWATPSLGTHDGQQHLQRCPLDCRHQDSKVSSCAWLWLVFLD